MIRATTTALAMACALAVTFSAAAQPPPPPPSPAVQQSLKVQVVLSRYQGEKKISSLPYTLTVTTNAPTTSLRMGAEVPVANVVFQGDKQPPVSSFNYRSIGTSIDCSAVALDGGRYSLRLLIEDSSIYPDDSATGADKIGTHPRFRSFKSDESVVLSDGQSAQYTTATDKVTSEVVKVDVTMSVLR
jgi:hypothetical protein